MLLPGWSPFHIAKVSYWSRTVLVPLLVLMALRPRARNPESVTIRELFVDPPVSVRDWISGPTSWPLSLAFGMLDRLLRLAEPYFPADARQRAIEKAVLFATERLNDEDGLGGIYPAIANSVMMFDCLGYAPDHPDYATALAATRKLLVLDGEQSYCQPCLSPVWDTAVGQAHGSSELARLIDVYAPIVSDGGELFTVAYQGRVAHMRREVVQQRLVLRTQRAHSQLRSIAQALD